MLLQDRCDKLLTLINLFLQPEQINLQSTSDFVKLQETIQTVAASMKKAAKTEIDLGEKIRDTEKLQIDISRLKCQMKTMNEKNLEL